MVRNSLKQILIHSISIIDNITPKYLKFEHSVFVFIPYYFKCIFNLQHSKKHEIKKGPGYDEYVNIITYLFLTEQRKTTNSQ